MATDTPRRTELDELRALSDAATPGDWGWNSYSAIFATGGGEDDGPVAYVPSRRGDLATIQGAHDAAFIVAAVNYVRSLLRDSRP